MYAVSKNDEKDSVAQKQSECLLRRMPFYKFVLMCTQFHSQTKDRSHWSGSKTTQNYNT